MNQTNEPVASVREIRTVDDFSWQEVDGIGQLKVGDLIRFISGKRKIETKVEEVLNEGTDEEEIIYNKKENYFFIMSMMFRGTSHVSELMVKKSTTVTITAAEYAKIKEDAERYQWLREPDNIHIVNYMSGDEHDYTCYTHCSDDLDQAIDQAIKDKK